MLIFPICEMREKVASIVTLAGRTSLELIDRDATLIDYYFDFLAFGFLVRCY